jgi:hypothetical protein
MFVTSLDVRAYRPDEWVLLAPLEWVSKDAHVVVPRGFITDLASVPRPLRGVLNVNGASRAPAVLHDFCYCSQVMATRKEADLLFLQALTACGVSSLAARAYYAGVRVGGWRYWHKRKSGLTDEDFAYI